MRGLAVVLVLCVAFVDGYASGAFASVSKSTESASEVTAPTKGSRKSLVKRGKSSATPKSVEVRTSTGTVTGFVGVTSSAAAHIAGSFTTLELEGPKRGAFKLGTVVYNRDIQALCVYLRRGWRRTTGAGGPCK